MKLPAGTKGFQKGHLPFGNPERAKPVYCKCGKQLAKSPSKRGKSGLCHKCAVSRPFDIIHKQRISEALQKHVRTPEHSAKIGAAARERYKDPTKVPNWQGGLSYEPYSPTFRESLKEEIRKRDGYLCQECFRTQDENGEKLSVHHIDYDKKNCARENLISLCGKCHLKTNYGRKEWTAYFAQKKK